jgi:zinc transport system ATP-binding protein
MKAPLVSLRNVSAGYDGKEVLRGVSLDIYDGDFVGITGPNGGGKTTLLKVAMGLLPYSSGSVEYADSLNVNGTRRIGYLPQQSAFDRTFPISVLDVVTSGLQTEKGFLGRYTREDFAKARNLLNLTGIASLERRPIGEISGGQMQRALLCRALIAEPRLLILDEPTTYIDGRFEEELYALLQKLNDGTARSAVSDAPLASNATPCRMAIVMVSHDTAALRSVARKIIRVDGVVDEITI